jgi:hypothetical protein
VPAICFPGDYFSYYTIVIPDESDCGGRDPVSSGLPLFSWIPDIPTSSEFRNDGNKNKAGFIPAVFSA